jgi:hypothetical protein
MTNRYLTFLAMFLSATPALAEPLTLSAGWVRESIPGQTVTVAYPQIANGGDRECTLAAVSAEVAGRVEIHEHQHSEGQMRMRKLDAIAIPAQGVRVFEPGGLHLMLLELRRPLVQGEKLTLTFSSGNCGEFSASLPVTSQQ